MDLNKGLVFFISSFDSSFLFFNHMFVWINFFRYVLVLTHKKCCWPCAALYPWENKDTSQNTSPNIPTQHTTGARSFWRTALYYGMSAERWFPMILCTLHFECVHCVLGTFTGKLILGVFVLFVCTIFLRVLGLCNSVVCVQFTLHQSALCQSVKISIEVLA